MNAAAAATSGVKHGKAWPMMFGMGSLDFQATRRLTTRAQARNALDDTIGQVRDRLCIFDDRGEFYGFDRRAVVEPLQQALRTHPGLRVTVLLHDPRYLQQRASRLVDTLRSFAPRFESLQTTSAVRAFSRGLIIADTTVVLRRPHFDAAVTIVDYTPEAVAQASVLFEELRAHTELAGLGNTTGLS